MAGVIPGTALYAAAVPALAAATSLAKTSWLRLKLETASRTWAGRVSAYLLLVTLLKMAVATAPARRREVPARPAAVPL